MTPIYQLDSQPLLPLTPRYAGTDYDKLTALVDEYAYACCQNYVAKAGSREQVLSQQKMLALGAALKSALIQVTSKA